ncbi:MAG: hypothetical protein ACK40M_02060 [Flavobacteriales bacterium]
MKRLSRDWFLQPSIDFELKSYTLLGWLQSACLEVNESKIYPAFEDLQFHLRSLEQFKTETDTLQEQFPKEIEHLYTGNPPKIIYKTKHEPDSQFSIIRSIIDWSIPRVGSAYKSTEERLLEIKSNTELFPVGIEPMYKKEGFLFIPDGDRELQIFSYRIGTIIEKESASEPVLNTQFVMRQCWTISTTLNAIKSDILKQSDIVPAVYFLRSEKSLPVNETLLPIAKIRLMEYLAGE